ncbi:MAG: TIR domain-containing protein [Acidobacteriota bacterium]
MAYDVFISYAHKDRQIAEAISAALAAERISCVIAPRGATTLTVEQSTVVCEVLSQSRLMMLLLTANANRFVSLIRELEHAVKKGIPVIPVCLEGTIIDPSIQYFIGPPVCTLTDLAVWQLRELASEIKERLEKIKQQLERPPRPDAAERRFCFHCGSALREGAKFCPHCGTQQRTFASLINPPAPPDSKQGNMRDASSSKSPPEPRANPGKKAIAVDSAPPPVGHSANTAAPPDPGGHHPRVDPALLAPTDRLTDSPSEFPPARPRPTLDAQSDPVDCTVFSRSEAQQGESLFIQVFAHMPEQAAAALAREFDSDAQRRGMTSLETEIRRGSRLTFHLSMPGVEIADPVQSLVWRGVPAAVQFEAIVSVNARVGTLIGTATISQDSVPIGHIKFKVKILAWDQLCLPEEAAPVGESRAYRKAFISYASPDRAEVLKRVQMLARLRISFFQDVLALEPGARWEREIYRRIDESDLFLLFWSRAARESRQVMEEVRYALRRKNGDEMAAPEILPVIIEGPPPASPPPELAHLHFNDYFLYFIAAQSGLTKNF